jgi:hypothetical protein
MVGLDGRQSDIEIIQETETELPPNVTTQLQWLKVHSPEMYNNEPIKIDHTTNSKEMPGNLIFMSADELTEEQMEAIIAKTTGRDIDM